MHVVEVVDGPGPVLLAVVDFELDVGGNPEKLVSGDFLGWGSDVPCRLYGTEVDGAHLGMSVNESEYRLRRNTCAAWILLAKVYGPYAGTCADVKGMLWVIEWCEIELVVVGEMDGCIFDIKPDLCQCWSPRDTGTLTDLVLAHRRGTDTLLRALETDGQ